MFACKRVKVTKSLLAATATFATLLASMAVCSVTFATLRVSTAVTLSDTVFILEDAIVSITGFRLARVTFLVSSFSMSTTTNTSAAAGVSKLFNSVIFLLANV